MNHKKLIIIFFTAIMFLFLVVILYFLFTKNGIKNIINNEEKIIESEYEITINNERPLDTDRDGIPDEEEVKLGTSITEFDTDGDGILDYDEINIWGTDPLNPDTDGDGFPDGLEIVTGYNPLGEGKLNQ